MVQPETSTAVRAIDDELRQMRDKLHERKRQLVDRNPPSKTSRGADRARVPSQTAAPSKEVTPSRGASKSSTVARRASVRKADGGPSGRTATVVPRPEDMAALRRRAATGVKNDKKQSSSTEAEAPPKEARWLASAHRAWKSQVAELLGEKARVETQLQEVSRWLASAHRAWKSQTAELLGRAKQAEQQVSERERWLASAHRAWKSQVSELLERARTAEKQVVERDRWLASAHRAWKSQTAELLQRLRDAEHEVAALRSGALADGVDTEEVGQLRKQLQEEQLGHIEELESIHDAYLRRAKEVAEAHTRRVDQLCQEKDKALNLLSDAQRVAQRLNERLERRERVHQIQAIPATPKEESPAPSPPSAPARKRRFLDDSEGAPTIIGFGVPQRPE